MYDFNSVFRAKCVLTGKRRAYALISGGVTGKSLAFSRKSATRMVADIITSRNGLIVVREASPLQRRSSYSNISFRSGVMRESRPINKSHDTLRSCASSITTTLYDFNRKSDCISFSTIPSVANLILQPSCKLESYRT